MEHVACRGDEQLYQIAASIAGGWKIVSCRAVKKLTEAVELHRLAATALGMSVWKKGGGNKRERIAADIGLW